MSLNYIIARNVADKEGKKTFGELASLMGYNVVALASRYASGWSDAEIELSKRDGLEFSRQATFDLNGKIYSTAGLFCSKYCINFQKLIELTEFMKTADEFKYIVRLLQSQGNHDEAIQAYKTSILPVAKPEEQSTSDEGDNIEAKDAIDKLTQAIINNRDQIKIIDGRGISFNSLSALLENKGYVVDEERFKKRLFAGFTLEESVSDILSNTYLASSKDTGEYDFPDGIDGCSFVDYCRKHGVLPQYALTKYRRGTLNQTIQDIVDDCRRNNGTLEACIRWFISLDGGS